MSMTPSTYLAKAIFPASFEAPDGRDHEARATTPPAPAAEPRRPLRVPPFPPAFLAFLGVVLLVAGAPAEPTESADRVSLSLGLILAALVWMALMLVSELFAARTPREG